MATEAIEAPEANEASGATEANERSGERRSWGGYIFFGLIWLNFP